MSDEAALLKAIGLHPEEDTPRLVYADWLEESGAPARAEFIRLECERARMEDEDSPGRALREFLMDKDERIVRGDWRMDRADKLDWSEVEPWLARYEDVQERLDALGRARDEVEPRGPERCGVHWTDSWRGFPARGEVGGPVVLCRNAKKLRATVPCARLTLSSYTEAHAKALVKAGLLRWLQALTLDRPTADLPAVVRTFGQHPDAVHVRCLHIPWGNVGDIWGAVADAVAAGPYWSGLRTLDFGQHCLIPSDGVTKVLRAPHLRGLVRLRVSWWDDEPNPEPVRALVEGGFTRLRDLRLGNHDLTDADAVALAKSPSLAGLRVLDLEQNNIGGAGATALLTSRHLKGLVALCLEGNPVSGLDRKALRGAEPGALRAIMFHKCQLTVRDVGALVRCPRLHNLVYLDLDANDLPDGAVRELIAGLPVAPPVLYILANKIGDKGAKELANWPGARGLRHLYFHGSSSFSGHSLIGDEGAAALAASPHLDRLLCLGLQLHPVRTTNGEGELRRRFGERWRQ